MRTPKEITLELFPEAVVDEQANRYVIKIENYGYDRGLYATGRRKDTEDEAWIDSCQRSILTLAEKLDIINMKNKDYNPSIRNNKQFLEYIGISKEECEKYCPQIMF